MTETINSAEKKARLDEIRSVIVGCVKTLVIEKDYKQVIINLTTGKVVLAGQALHWRASDPESAYDLEPYRNLKDPEDFSEIVSNLATNAHAVRGENGDGGRLDLPFIDSFKEPNFFKDPHNGYDNAIRYDLADVQRLAFENCLLLLEEWCHVLQWETGEALSSKFRSKKDGEYDAEDDVAFYFRNLGINLSGTIFERRYSGVRKISGFLKKNQN